MAVAKTPPSAAQRLGDDLQAGPVILSKPKPSFQIATTSARALRRLVMVHRRVGRQLQ